MIFMDDGEIQVLKTTDASFIDFNGARLDKPVTQVDLNPVMAEKGGYKHFMLKEIFEQARAVTDTFRGRVSEEKGGLSGWAEVVGRRSRKIQKIVILACGTSYHAGLVGRRIIEGLTRIPVEVDLASEFRYRDPIVDDDTLLVSISQSGETADTIAATKEGASRGAVVVSICNVIESSLAALSSHGVIYTLPDPRSGWRPPRRSPRRSPPWPYICWGFISGKRGSLEKDRTGDSSAICSVCRT